LKELRRILSEKFHIPGKTIDQFISLLEQEGEIIKGETLLSVSIQDKDDVPVVSEAAAGNVEVLVTGDRDILEIAKQLPFRALSPRGFWEELRKDIPPV
jgi:predicted nucleic acid-binding protein